MFQNNDVVLKFFMLKPWQLKVKRVYRGFVVHVRTKFSLFEDYLVKKSLFSFKKSSLFNFTTQQLMPFLLVKIVLRNFSLSTRVSIYLVYISAAASFSAVV